MGINSIIFLAAGSEKVTAERINTALLNTVMCISIVFVALIAISLIISLFQYIPKLEAYFSKTQTSSMEAVSPPVAQLPQVPFTVEQEEELSDDAALAAVITAAIYAYEESLAGEDYVPADGIIVKSIKKANKSRWQRPSA